MSRRNPIRRGAIGRSLAVSVAGLRAGGAFALGSAIGKLRGEEGATEEVLRREARRFTAELGKLKGTYVKIGQLFALMGEHFLPAPLTEALHDLESQTHPVPWSELEPSVKDALGSCINALTIDEEPLAAASLAQVHRATASDITEDLVLKMQYPDLAAVIDDDFDAVVRMLKLARWIPAGRDLDNWLEEMRTQLHHEIDYQRERSMTVAAAERLASHGEIGHRYRVPRVHERYCADTVLALDYIEGHRVTETEVSTLSQARRNRLGAAMLELFFLELFEWGVLQTDPNFGNYLIEIDAKGDRLVLLDFGSTIECSEDFRGHFADAITAGQLRDKDLLIRSLEGLGCLRPGATEFARESFAEFCQMMLEPLRAPDQLPEEYLNEDGLYCWGRSRLMQRVGKFAASSAATQHFATPSGDFALIVRKLAGVFTFITVLDAEFNGHAIAQKYMEAWVDKRLSA